jgi:nicotinamidase-related amidase
MTSRAYCFPPSHHAYREPQLPMLLCHDIVAEGEQTEEQASWRTCIHNASLLLSEARRCHWPIVHAYSSSSPPAPIEAVRPYPEEPVFQCHGPSAFSSAGLRALLSVSPPLEVLLVGRSFLPMCLATAAASADLGLPLSVVSDGVSVSRVIQEKHSEGGISAARELVALFAKVTTTAQVLRLASSLQLLSQV